MIRGIKAVALFIAGAVLMSGCSITSNVPTFSNTTGKLKVAASFYPMYEFTRMVGGDHIELVTLTPVGVEPHDWSPSPGHLRLLNQADILVYNGIGMEPWVSKTLASLDNKKIIAVEASKGLQLIKGKHDHDDDHDDDHDKDHKDHDDDHDDHDDYDDMDPHLWLDPIRAAGQVNAIRDALIQADPTNRASYEQNAAAYVLQLRALDAEMERGLTGCAKDEFFTTHAAFGYLANRYGLEQHAMMGLSPDAEPTPHTMAKIIVEAREHGVKYVFFETLVSDKVANLLAKEIGAQTLVLNPLEGLTEAEVKAGKTYITVMQENLKNLRLALECR